MDNVLNKTTVLALGKIVTYAVDGSKVARAIIDANGRMDTIVMGIARAIVHSPDNPGFLGDDDDVRDGYLWVTTENGWEAFWPVRELVRDYIIGSFTAYDW
jgi:hypothetical protein